MAMMLVLRAFATVVLWGLIEWASTFFAWGIAWWVGLITAAVLCFFGELILKSDVIDVFT